VLKKWALELANKEMRKLTHENRRGIPAPDVPAENQESQRWDKHGGAEPYVYGVDIQAGSKGDPIRPKDIVDDARSSGRPWNDGRFDLSRGRLSLSCRRLSNDDGIPFSPAIFDRLLEDARAPSGTKAVVL
jgi:hypothetical protein